MRLAPSLETLAQQLRGLVPQQQESGGLSQPTGHDLKRHHVLPIRGQRTLPRCQRLNTEIATALKMAASWFVASATENHKWA